MLRDLCRVERPDLTGMIHVPDRGFRRGRDGGRAVGGQKDLGGAGLEFLNQRSLPVGFEPALYLVNERDRRVALVLPGDGERRQSAGSGSPARKGQLDAVAIRGEADH